MNLLIIKLNQVKKKIIRKRLSISNEKVIIGMIARYDKYKDHDTFIKSAKLILEHDKNLIFLLVGKNCNSANKNLVNKINEFKISNHFKLLGYKKNIHQIYSILDINILTSFSESFPNVIAESMLSGIPCIASNVGEIKEIVGKTGWIVKKNDAGLLCFQLKKALKDFKSKKNWNVRKRKCIKRIATKYHINEMVKGYYNVWKNSLI